MADPIPIAASSASSSPTEKRFGLVLITLILTAIAFLLFRRRKPAR